MICPPYLDHVEIASAKYRMKACLGHSLITVLLKKFKCCAYTDTVPYPWLEGTCIYSVYMRRDTLP